MFDVQISTLKIIVVYEIYIAVYRFHVRVQLQLAPPNFEIWYW